MYAGHARKKAAESDTSAFNRMFFTQAEGNISSFMSFCVRTAKGRRTQTESATTGTMSTMVETLI